MGPAMAAIWYSPAGTPWRTPLQPSVEVLRSQDRCSTAGTPRVRTIMLDPPPLTQSAELQMRRPPLVMTTATNLVPMLKRHGRGRSEMALTVKRGVAPGWYQFCCWVERRRFTAPGVQARAGRVAAGAAALWCGDGSGLERGEDDGRADARSARACAGAELTDCVAAGPVACDAVERAASSPFAAQLTAASSPMPMARTVTRRRQYVAGETLAGGRRGPRAWPARPRGL